MKNIEQRNKWISISLLVYSLIAVGILTLSMILVSIGFKQVCLYENNLVISLIEVFLGIMAMGFLINKIKQQLTTTSEDSNER